MNKYKHFLQKTSVIHNFLAIVHALYLREINTRFGSKGISYLVALLDAVVPILIFSLVHSALRGEHHTTYDHAVFVAVGFLGFNFFKNFLRASMDLFESNFTIYSYKQIRPIHSLFALYLVEFIVIFFIAVFLLAVGFVLQRDLTVEHFTMVLFAFLWLTFFAFSVGLVLSVLAHFFKGIRKIVNLMFLPLMFLSALFYSVDSLPYLFREYILWNPLVHFMEMLHGNYFEALDTSYVSYPYMFFWTFLPLWIGLYLYRLLEKKIIAHD